MSDDEESERAKYLDFKCYFDTLHVNAGSTDEVDVPQPVGHVVGTGSSETGYEWIYSRVSIPDDLDLQKGEYPIHVIGPNNFTSASKSVGLIHNYALARSRPQDEDPNVPVDDGGALGGSYLNLMFDFGGGSLQEVIANVVGENNEPPYPVGMNLNAAGQPTEEYYPGGANFLGAADQHEYARTQISGNFSGSTTTIYEGNGFLPGALMPLGLLRLKVTNATSTGLQLEAYADMVAGDKRGYMSMSMLEMN
jgi:hypothetical protein